MTSKARRKARGDRIEALAEKVQPDEVLPEDLQRIDEPDEVPGPAPSRGQQPALEGVTPAPDGGVEQHPVHDEDLEDRGPDDYQKEVDAVEDAQRGRWRED